MATLPTDGYDREALQTFLVDYRLALGSGDLEALDDRFAFPALLIEPEASTLLPDPEAVLSAAHRLDGGRAEESVATVPEVLAVEHVGWALLWVDVRWTSVDENASAVGSDHVRYLLRRGREAFEICVVTTVVE